MAQSISFVGLPEEDLLQIRDAALDQIKNGYVTVTGSTGGKSFGRQVTSSPEQRLAAALEALRLLDPDRYGKIETQTVVQFT